MASINYATREISCKIVFYGPGLSGKTTNLQIIHRKIPDKDKSEMVSLATETDRTLFFDFLPLDLGSIKGFSTKFQLYTVPGQVYYNATRKLVLRGVDGVVFVVDSQIDKMQENIESFANLQENLREYGHSVESIPMVLQYNKRDLPNIYPVDQLNALFNKQSLPYCEAVAATGVGVFTTLKSIGKLVIDRFNAKYAGFQGSGGRRMQPGQTAQSPAARPAAPPPPAPAPQQPQSPFLHGGGGMGPGPGMPMGAPPQRPAMPGQAGGHPGFPPGGNPFMASPSGGMAFPPQPGAQGQGQPPFMIPTPFHQGAGPGGGMPGGFSPPGFPGNAQGPMAQPPFPGGQPPFPGGPGQFPGQPPMGRPGPAFQPPQGMTPPFGNPQGPGSPYAKAQPPIPGPAGPGNIPVPNFVDSFNAHKGPPQGNMTPPLQGLESSSPFGNPQGRGPGAPFPGMGAPAAPAFPGGPAPTPYPGGVRSPATESPFGQAQGNDPSQGQQPGNPGGLKGSLGEDSSGIISTYEDARDESFKTRKLPLPGEKKKGFFDGLFRKDK